MEIFTDDLSSVRARSGCNSTRRGSHRGSSRRETAISSLSGTWKRRCGRLPWTISRQLWTRNTLGVETSMKVAKP